VTLRAISDYGNFATLDDREIRILVIKDFSHCYSLSIWFGEA